MTWGHSPAMAQRMSETPEPSEPGNAPRSGDRIAKLLARAGVASRREVERLIEEGRVRINDEVVTTPATLLTSLRGVTVDGKVVKSPEPARLFMFHKPSGLITAERDPSGKPTIYTALRNALPPGTPRVMPIGRLDLNTEGLLLLTNDGELKRAMELPSSGIPRTYRARTFGDISQAQLEELIEGITIDGMHYGKIDANLERRTGRNQWIELTLTEGKNREVRRVLEHLGLETSRLLRTSYGPFELLDLPRGQVVEIRQVDLERFRKGLLTEAPTTVAGQRPVRDEADREAHARVARTRPAGAVAPRPENRDPEERSARPHATKHFSANPHSGRQATPGKAFAKRPGNDKVGNNRTDFAKSAAGKPYAAKPAIGKPAIGKPYATRPSDSRRPDGERPVPDRAEAERTGPGRRGASRYGTEGPLVDRPKTKRPSGNTRSGPNPRGPGGNGRRK